MKKCFTASVVTGEILRLCNKYIFPKLILAFPVLRTYPAEWQIAHHLKKYSLVDPVIKHGSTALEICFDCDDLYQISEGVTRLGIPKSAGF